MAVKPSCLTPQWPWLCKPTDYWVPEEENLRLEARHLSFRPESLLYIKCEPLMKPVSCIKKASWPKLNWTIRPQVKSEFLQRLHCKREKTLCREDVDSRNLRIKKQLKRCKSSREEKWTNLSNYCFNENASPECMFLYDTVKTLLSVCTEIHSVSLGRTVCVTPHPQDSDPT